MIFGFVLAIIVSLFALSYFLNGKSLFHPATAFCLVWAINLAVIAACGNIFYPLHAKTLMVIALGCITFCGGSAIPYKPKAPVESTTRNRLLTIGVLGVIVSVPFLIRWMMALNAETGIDNFLVASRLSMLEVFENRQYPLYTNLITFSAIIALIAFNERRKLWVIAVPCALFINVLTSRRMGIVSLIICLFCLDYFHTRKLRWKAAALTLALVIGAMGGLALYIGIGSVDTQDSITANIKPVLEGLALYESGATFVMDREISEPNLLPPQELFVVSAASRFGHHIPWRDPADDFVKIGPEMFDNVATVYHGYNLFNSWGFAALAMLPLGAISTLFYRRAIAGWPMSRLIYAFCFLAIIVSPFADEFLGGLNFLLKMCAVAWLIHRPITASVESPLTSSR